MLLDARAPPLPPCRVGTTERRFGTQSQARSPGVPRGRERWQRETPARVSSTARPLSSRICWPGKSIGPLSTGRHRAARPSVAQGSRLYVSAHLPPQDPPWRRVTEFAKRAMGSSTTPPGLQATTTDTESSATDTDEAAAGEVLPPSAEAAAAPEASEVEIGQEAEESAPPPTSANSWLQKLNSVAIPKVQWQWLAALASPPRQIEAPVEETDELTEETAEPAEEASGESQEEAGAARQTTEAEKVEQGTAAAEAEAEQDARLPDELHYVRVPHTQWEMALWRYLPAEGAPQRQHAAVLIPGCASNARPFDLAPRASLAHYLAQQGYDTWSIEMRGVGLSRHVGSPWSSGDEAANSPGSEQAQSAAGTAEAAPGSPGGAAAAGSAGLEGSEAGAEEEGVSEDDIGHYGDGRGVQAEAGAAEALPISARLRAFGFDRPARWWRWVLERSLWDVDTYIREDLPAAIEFVVSKSQPSSGKVIGVGHSMGGMILYAMAGTRAAAGGESPLAGIVTLASGLRLVPKADAGRPADPSLLPAAPPDGGPAAAEVGPGSRAAPRGEGDYRELLSAQPGAAAAAGSTGNYAAVASIGSRLPELTHVLPVPVDRVSQVQSSMLHSEWTVARLGSALTDWDVTLPEVRNLYKNVFQWWNSSSSSSPPEDAPEDSPEEDAESALEEPLQASAEAAASGDGEGSSEAPSSASWKWFKGLLGMGEEGPGRSAELEQAVWQELEEAEEAVRVSFDEFSTFHDGDEDAGLDGDDDGDAPVAEASDSEAEASEAREGQTRAYTPWSERVLQVGVRGTTSGSTGAAPAPLVRKLLNVGFETVPLALLVQMATLFTASGLRPREAEAEAGEEGAQGYLDLLQHVDLPILAVAGGMDPVVPPLTVRDTVEMAPRGRYVCCGREEPCEGDAGGEGGAGAGLEASEDVIEGDREQEVEYSHYDLLVGTAAQQEVFPQVASFMDEIDRAT